MSSRKANKDHVVHFSGPRLAYKKNKLYSKLLKKEENIAVVGLGYVGLPLAIHMGNMFKVLGFDLNSEKIIQLNQHKDPTKEIDSKGFEGKDLVFSSDEQILKEAKFYIVAVPTPIDSLKKPNLVPLKSATASIAKYLKKGDCVVFESTVFPGCTEEVCVPILERVSRLKLNEDFYVGYSPERINPGDKKHTFTNIKKIVSGSNKIALDLVANVYGSIVIAGVHKASSIKVAEAAKVVENIQRDVNIGLMNELAQIFNVLQINTKEVLDAAGTKWNFHAYFPGLVGGHCIGIDPYYLITKAKEKRYHPRLLQQARQINEGMISYIISKLETKVNIDTIKSKKSTILVKGIAFKENVSDIRNSKTAELCQQLIKKGYHVDVEDYLVVPDEVQKRYGIVINNNSRVKEYDLIILAVDHDNYKKLSYGDLLERGTRETMIFDLKGDKKHRFPSQIYISL